jgi:hypothetical protein
MPSPPPGVPSLDHFSVNVGAALTVGSAAAMKKLNMSIVVRNNVASLLTLSLNDFMTNLLPSMGTLGPLE